MSHSPGPPTDSASWNQRYVDGQLPWDTGRPDVHLPTVLDRHAITSGRALEVGCGTGTNAIWLAQRGFEVHATDLSPRAVELARQKAQAAGVDLELSVVDFLTEEIPASGSFDAVGLNWLLEQYVNEGDVEL